MLSAAFLKAAICFCSSFLYASLISFSDTFSSDALRRILSNFSVYLSRALSPSSLTSAIIVLTVEMIELSSDFPLSSNLSSSASLNSSEDIILMFMFLLAVWTVAR